MYHCLKCDKEITERNSKKYCSLYCQKLYLKSGWRKRNRETQNEYNRVYRKKGMRHLTDDDRRAFLNKNGKFCRRCNSIIELDLHHIKPLRLKGTNETNNIIIFCKPCHRKWHKEFDNKFWEL